MNQFEIGFIIGVAVGLFFRLLAEHIKRVMG